MSEIAIRAEKLGKRYLIGAREAADRNFRELLTGMLAAPFRRIGRLVSGKRATAGEFEELWALRDVSFEIKQGEVVGVIGRNGAGKSTLLKVLSRITEPTEGFAEIRGRVGSLLEVGTGFHPELTGRENIFLNGAILGMKRVEIRAKFDEIVEFAGVEKFIDTAVKHYSSGMYLRLAFSVAAHMEPEILLVDEVLAVGDAEFQKRCLGKMEQIGGRGRTVVFVSHNMDAITRLCGRCILLDAGGVVCVGPTTKVIGEYLRSGTGTTAEREWLKPESAPGNSVARLRRVSVKDPSGSVAEVVDIREPVEIEMEYDVLEDGHVLVPNLHFFNEAGLNIFVSGDLDDRWRRTPRPRGRYVSVATVPGNLLSEGILVVGAALSTFAPIQVHFYEQDAVAFMVRDSLAGDSARGDYAGQLPGVVRPLLEWRTRYEPSDSPLAASVAQESQE